MFLMTNATFAQANESRLSAPAVRKALRVLDLVAADGGVGISEIARRTNLSKSTVHGLVGALLDEGALVAGDGGLALGPRLAALASSARDGRVLEAGQSAVTQLAEKTGETALFGRANGDSVTILARADGARTVTVSAPLGARVPLSARALADASVRPVRFQSGATASRPFAIDQGNYLAGIVGIAAAIVWQKVTYFIWTVSLDALHDDAGLQRLGAATADAAAGLLARLGEDRSSRVPERSES